MDERGSDAPRRRWLERMLRRLPSSARYRLFSPAYEDLRQEHLARLRAARWPAARPFLAARFVVGVLAIVAGSYRRTPSMIFVHPARVAAEALRALALGNSRMVSHDFRHAARLVWKQPLFSTVAILILALGIGASTAIFSVVDAVLLRPLPFPGDDRLVALMETFDGRDASVSPVNFFDWRRDAKAFHDMALYTEQSMTLRWGDRTVAVVGYAASSSFFPVLGVRPAYGRWFGPEDDTAGGPQNVVLSHALWTRGFGGATDVIGQQAYFDGEPYTVIGVAPPGVALPEQSEAWFSLGLSPRQTAATARGAHYAEAVARLRPGVTLDQANAELATIAKRLAAAYTRTNEGHGARAVGLLDAVVGPARRALLLVLGAVGGLLLVACVNVSGLLMARGTTRRTEMAVRAALGAGRLALVRQVLVESVVLAGISALVGTLLAVWGTSGLLAIVPADLPRIGGVGLDWRVLAFAALIAVGSAMVFGLLPALQSAAGNPGHSLKEGRGDSTSGGSPRLRAALVSVEVALAFVLLVGAGLAIRSFDLLTRVSPGFNPKDVLMFAVSLPEAAYKEPAQSAAFFRDLVSELDRQPGITSAAAVMFPPVSASGFGGTFSIEGRPESGGAAEPRAQLRPITPEYFRTLGVTLRRGRAFTARDNAGAPPVAVVSETTARRFWPGEDPIGRRIRMHVSAVRDREPFREIVGVAADVKTGRLDMPAAPVVYIPHAQHATGYMTVLARTAGEASRFAGTAQNVLRNLDRSLVALEVQTLEERLASSRGAHRFRAVLLGLFGGAALLLAVVGLYAVMAYSTSRRRHEIGVRMALGAGTRQIVRMVLGDGLRPVVAGLILGVAGAFASSQLMTGLLFGVRPFEPLIVLLAAALLFGAAAVACFLPARRAATIDPRDALRAE